MTTTTQETTMTSYHARPDCYPVHCEANDPCPRHAVAVDAQQTADAIATATGARYVTVRVERREADGSLTVLEKAIS